MGICAFFSSKVVKRFEFPKALYKFPSIIIITIIIAEMVLHNKNSIPSRSIYQDLFLQIQSLLFNRVSLS